MPPDWLVSMGIYFLPCASASAFVRARFDLETHTLAEAQGEHIRLMMPCTVNLFTISVAAGLFKSFTGMNFEMKGVTSPFNL